MRHPAEPMPREYPPVPLIGVGAVIVSEQCVVLVKRGRPPAMGEWSIPGGLVTVGETLHEAVIRETREETGLVVQVVELVALLERIFPDQHGHVQYHYVIADYLCRVQDGVLQPDTDVIDAVWASGDALNEFALPSVTIDIVRRALDMP